MTHKQQVIEKSMGRLAKLVRTLTGAESNPAVMAQIERELSLVYQAARQKAQRQEREG